MHGRIDDLPLASAESRAWQHVAAEALLDGIITRSNGSWSDLSGIGQHTAPSPEEYPQFRDDLPLDNERIPQWVPNVMR